MQKMAANMSSARVVAVLLKCRGLPWVVHLRISPVVRPPLPARRADFSESAEYTISLVYRIRQIIFTSYDCDRYLMGDCLKRLLTLGLACYILGQKYVHNLSLLIILFFFIILDSVKVPMVWQRLSLVVAF